MIMNTSTWVLLIYLSFALDSALKIGDGIQIHIGILCILITNLLTLAKNPSTLLKPLKKESTFFLFILYSLISGLIAPQPGYWDIAIYLAVTINVILYTNHTYKLITRKFFYNFQILMIITGLTQYILYKIGGVQLSFINAEHYEKGYSVSFRLRGFFIEPNWFAISLAFNTLLLTGSNIFDFIKKSPYIAALTALIMILNGSLTTIGALAVIYSVPIVKKNPLKGTIYSSIIFLVLISVLSYRSAINQDKDNDSLLNYASRWIPFTRAIEYQVNQETSSILFGQGLGSWGTIAVRNRISALVHEEEPSARDGSELPVFIFEIGLIGIALLLIDLCITYIRTPTQHTNIRGGLILFVICLAFYPTLKFWMYMPYYFYLRRARYEASLFKKISSGRHKNH